MSSNESTHERNSTENEGGTTSDAVSLDINLKLFRKDIFEVLAKYEKKLGSVLLPMATDIVTTIRLASIVEQVVRVDRERTSQEANKNG